MESKGDANTETEESMEEEEDTEEEASDLDSVALRCTQRLMLIGSESHKFICDLWRTLLSCRGIYKRFRGVNP